MKNENEKKSSNKQFYPSLLCFHFAYAINLRFFNSFLIVFNTFKIDNEFKQQIRRRQSMQR